MHIKNLLLAFTLALLLAFPALAGVPVASSFSTSVPVNRQAAITMLGSDPEATPLVYAIGTSPSHGTLMNLNTATGVVIYTPATDYTGADSFTYTVTSGGQTSGAGTVTLTVTSAKTRIIDTITDASGAPRTGTVTFILTQQVTTPSGISPKAATVSAALNSSGQFDVQVYPSKSLSPEAYYQVWFADSRTLNRELIGVYEIPLATSTITLGPYKITDTNLAARYSFISAAQANALGTTLGAIYNGTPTDNAVQKHDSATGKIEDSSIFDNGTIVTIGNKVQMPGTKALTWDSTGVNAPSTTDNLQGTKLLVYPAVGPDQSAVGVESGFTWFTTGGGFKFYFDAANPDLWEPAGLTITGHVTATNFIGNGSSLTNLNASNLASGTVPLARLSGITNTEIDAAAAIAWSKINKTGSSLADLTTRSAADLSSGTLPDARFPATLPALSGANLTALNATNLSSGTVPDARFPATLPVASGVNLTALNASNLASGTVLDARFPATLPAVSGANLTALNGSNISSGTVTAARLGSGGAGGGTRFLADNNTWVLPESLGLLDSVTPSDGAYTIFGNSHTLLNGYLKQAANGVALDGTASGPYFDIYANGLLDGANTTGARVYAETSAIEFGAFRSGTFGSQNIAVRFNARGDGEIQFRRNNTTLWAIDADNTIVPTSAYGLGTPTNPVDQVTIGDHVKFTNSGFPQVYFRSLSPNSVAIRNNEDNGFGQLELGDGVFDRSGHNSPEGVVTANIGSVYRRTNGSTGTTLYIKESGTGNTGWVAVAGGGGAGFSGTPTSGAVPYYDGSGLADSPITASVPGSMVNGITVTGAATGNTPTISPTGGDTNIGLTLNTKGTGSHRLQIDGTNVLVLQTDGVTPTVSVANGNFSVGGNIRFGGGGDAGFERTASNTMSVTDGGGGSGKLRIDRTNGTAISGVMSNTAALDYSSIAANATTELTITVTGAAAGDSVQVNPNGAPETGLIWSGYVSAADTVTVRLANVTTGAIDPASRTWRATVTKF